MPKESFVPAYMQFILESIIDQLDYLKNFLSGLSDKDVAYMYLGVKIIPNGNITRTTKITFNQIKFPQPHLCLNYILKLLQLKGQLKVKLVNGEEFPPQDVEETLCRKEAGQFCFRAGKIISIDFKVQYSTNILNSFTLCDMSVWG